ncbi:MAG: hypothetical protein KJ597_04430 [Nanoarchaeota archaeon]|nr:hypothetical protein [Nanoarchaeota archaeon]MBU1622795.1 hypothetical protein [Nanoarchaeota archaeon]
MKFKYKLILFATTFAIAFTTLIYVFSKYRMLWFSLEVIILPLIYYMGYEIMMDGQRESFNRSIDLISNEMNHLDNENKELRLQLKYSKKKNK